MKHTVKIGCLVVLIFIVLTASIYITSPSEAFTVNRGDYVIEEIPNFLTKDECDKIIALSQSKLTQSKVFSVDEDSEDPTVRVSKQTWLNDSEDALIRDISNRIAQRTHTTVAQQESMQVVKYDENGFYKPHFDACDQSTRTDCERMNLGQGHRLLTFIMYLNDDFDGGETYFPKLDYKIIPQTGKAAIFYNVEPNGNILQASMHGGLDVKNGEKWIANKWIHQYS
jgi:prolyl 4-hydroxylase